MYELLKPLEYLGYILLRTFIFALLLIFGAIYGVVYAFDKLWDNYTKRVFDYE